MWYFIDLKKAFDTINHSILLRKLEHYGIRGIPLQWFHSYLSNHKQYVSVNGFLSDELNIIHGVPQGSVLGPLPRGGTCQNLDRDAHPIFLGLKFGQILFFWVGKIFSYFSGFRKISAIFWV